MEASWKRLGASWPPKNPRLALDALVPLAVAEAPLEDSLGFLLDFLMYILGIY